MAKKLACPECKTGNPVPAPGTRKITCEGCGMILVMPKILGENWEKKLEAAAGDAAAPRKPKITSRRPRQKDDASEAPVPSAATGRKTGRIQSRTTLGRSRGAGSEGQDSPYTGRRPAKKGMSPMVMGVSILSVVVVAVIGVIVYNAETKSRAEAEAAEQAEIEKKKQAQELRQAKIDAMLAEGDGAESGDGANAAGSDSEKPAAITEEKADKPAKKKSRGKIKFADLTAFEAHKEASEEENKAILEQILVLQDVNATTAVGRARDALMATPRKSIPHLINAMIKLKMDDKDDTFRGFQIIQVLWDCAQDKKSFDDGFRIFDWPTDKKEIERGSATRMTAVKQWWKWWDKEGATWTPPVDDDEDF